MLDFDFIKDHWLQLVLVSITAYLLQSFIKQFFLRKLPPGPIGLPFLGYLPFLGEKPHETFSQLSKKYGKVIGVNIGRKYMVVMNDYETMKEALCHPSALHKDPDTLAILPESGFSNKNGDEWEEQRRFAMQSMRNLGIGRGPWEKRIQEEIPNFLNELKKLQGKPSVIDELLAYTVGTNILSLLIGRKLEKEKDKEYIQLTHDFSDAIVQNTRSVSLLSTVLGMNIALKWLGIGKFQQAQKTINKFSQAVRKEILKHKTEEMSDKTDFINIYLEKLKSKVKSGGKHYFTESNAEGNIALFFLGGSDTILASLGWLFRIMAAYPKIQKKVQEELDDVIGTDGMISYEDKSKIPYTFAVLMEGQRFSSIVPMSPPRIATSDFEVNGYIIPKGASLMANFEAIHHDPKYWKEPEEFKPERFLSDDGSKLLSNLSSFAAFSIGRRNCPGETVAWMEIMTFFTSVLQRFTISLPYGEKPSFKYITGIVSHLAPQELRFVERRA